MELAELQAQQEAQELQVTQETMELAELQAQLETQDLTEILETMELAELQVLLEILVLLETQELQVTQEPTAQQGMPGSWEIQELAVAVEILVVVVVVVKVEQEQQTMAVLEAQEDHMGPAAAEAAQGVIYLGMQLLVTPAAALGVLAEVETMDIMELLEL
jgi:hypothetical protein